MSVESKPTANAETEALILRAKYQAVAEVHHGYARGFFSAARTGIIIAGVCMAILADIGLTGGAVTTFALGKSGLAYMVGITKMLSELGGFGAGIGAAALYQGFVSKDKAIQNERAASVN